MDKGGRPLKLFSVFLAAVFMLTVAPARANWCQKPGGGIEACGTIPGSWSQCGTFNGAPVWCWPSSGTKVPHQSNSPANGALIAVGVGVAFVAVMWLAFGMRPSSTDPGQVRLMSF